MLATLHKTVALIKKGHLEKNCFSRNQQKDIEIFIKVSRSTINCYAFVNGEVKNNLWYQGAASKLRSSAEAKWWAVSKLKNTQYKDYVEEHDFKNSDLNKEQHHGKQWKV